MPPAVPGARPKRDDDATRVHRVPKEILLRLQARAAASTSESLSAERTAVFRAPPELLERAKGMGLAREHGNSETAEEELTQPQSLSSASSPPRAVSAADANLESSTLLEFQDSTEAASGISERPQGLGPRDAEAVAVSVVAAETPSVPSPAAQPVSDDSASWSPVPAARIALHPDVDELLSAEPAEAEQELHAMLDSRDSLLDSRDSSSSDRLSEPPQFRKRSGTTLVVIVLLAVAVVLFALTQR